MTNPEIEVINEHDFKVDVERLVAAASQVISQLALDPASSLSIVIETNEYVAGLNQQFRGIDAPTDVLSFPAEQPPDEIMDEMLEDEPPYLGDLVIAYPYALAQAEHEGHDPGDSFALLVVHGTLHLAGYDHDTPEHRAEMWAAQEQALIALGISPDIVPALEGALSHDGQDE
jgi:probable rRNA maturation factor